MIYGVYFAYNKWDVLPDEVCKDATTPNYPSEIARVRIYPNHAAQLEAYANVRCPASQTIEAKTQEEFDEKVAQMKKNFLDDEWVVKNISPYL